MANLITLSEFKEFEGISSDKDDQQLFNYIESVSQLVKTYCGIAFVDFVSSDKVEFLNIEYDKTFIFLTESPVISVTSVETRETPISSYSTLDSNSYAIDSLTDSVYLFDLGTGQPKKWPIGPNAVKVTYRAGYESTPHDLKLAVIDLVNYYKLDEHKPRQSSLNQSRENYVATSDFPDHIKRVLDLYKVHV